MRFRQPLLSSSLKKATPNPADFYTGHVIGKKRLTVPPKPGKEKRGERVLTGLIGGELRVSVTARVPRLDHHLQLEQLGLRSGRQRPAAPRPPRGMPEHVPVVPAGEAEVPAGP